MKQLKGKPTARLLRASKMGLKMTDMFHDGPAKLTVSDAWTLIHPEVAKRNINFNSAIAGFQPGWLVDKVLFFFINIECLLHTTFLHEMLSFFIFSKVIEAVLWRLTLIHRDIFVADTTMAEMVKRHSSTRLLWSGENFTQISKIFIPMNKSGNHWTLLVRTLR